MAAKPLLRSQLHRPLLLLVRLVGADLHQGAGEAAPVVRVGRRQLKESRRKRQPRGKRLRANPKRSAPPLASLGAPPATQAAACGGWN